MPVTVMIRDETAAGVVQDERPLEFPSERLTVRDLIRERVYQEVQDFNNAQHQQAPAGFRGLVQPSESERVLNGGKPEFRLKAPRRIDWKEQLDKALDAFGRNGFLVLVDDRQAESLDDEFTIGRGTTISFVRMTMLVGG